MASLTTFDSFVEALAEKVHNLGSDTLKLALCNVAPVAANTKLADLTEIAYTNLPTSRNLTVSASAQSGGVYKLTIADITLTATGTVATFRYIVLYNDSATNKELIGWLDYGLGGITLLAADTFTVDFDGTEGVLQIL